MIRGISRSLGAYSESFKYLSYPWVLKYLILSGFISLVVFGILCSLVFYSGDGLGLNILNSFYDNDAPSFLTSIVGWLTKILLWVLLFLVLKYVILIVSAPFMSALSERLEERLSPGYKDPKPNQLYSTVRGVRLALSNVVRELFLTIPLVILSFFFPFLAILIFIIQAYYAGFGNLDFFMERRFSSIEARRFINENRGLAIGNGSGFLLLFMIPIIGAFIAPTLATIAGTITCVELMEYDDF